MVFQAALQTPKIDNDNLKCAFVTSFSLALLSSTASILTFLAILCSTYAEEDFLVSLPLKLIVDLATLLFSILTMLLAFTMAIIMLSPNKPGWIIVAAFAWIVGGVYVWLHFPLLVVVYRSTFGAKYLFRPQYELLRD
uniref:PGG domain-containing protein n=2 Tax=Chenopodium quinoa TaxID=63459 RepID=A0A803MUW6_CHEQI